MQFFIEICVEFVLNERIDNEENIIAALASYDRSCSSFWDELL